MHVQSSTEAEDHLILSGVPQRAEGKRAVKPQLHRDSEDPPEGRINIKGVSRTGR